MLAVFCLPLPPISAHGRLTGRHDISELVGNGEQGAAAGRREESKVQALIP